MAGDPEDLTIRILREIQASLFNHDLRFEQIDKRFETLEQRIANFETRVDARFERMQTQIDHRFDQVDRRLSEVLDTAITALGSAGHSNVRHETVQHQIAEFELEIRDLKSRLQRLEERV